MDQNLVDKTIVELSDKAEIKVELHLPLQLYTIIHLHAINNHLDESKYIERLLNKGLGISRQQTETKPASQESVQPAEAKPADTQVLQGREVNTNSVF